MENKKNLEELGNKENNFSIPENYFDFLPEQIMNRIHRSKQEKRIFLLKPSIAIPSFAVLSGIIILIIFLNRSSVASEDFILSDIDTEQVVENPELYSITSSAITEQYLASNISDEAASDETIPDEDAKSYLEENSDVPNIINE